MTIRSFKRKGKQQISLDLIISLQKAINNPNYPNRKNKNLSMTEHEKPILDDIEGSEPTKKLKTENVLE